MAEKKTRDDESERTEEVRDDAAEREEDVPDDGDVTDETVTDAEDAPADETVADEESGPDDEAERPKVKMPQAKDIKRSDFTPHALGAKSSPRRPATRKAAKRRKALYAVGGVVVVALVAGAVALSVTKTKPTLKLKGAFGKTPVLSVPKGKPLAKQEIKPVIKGTGAQVKDGDFVVLNLVGYQWTASGTKKELLNTYTKGQPAAGPTSQLTGLAPLDKSVIGQKVGTRLQVTLPYQAVGDQIGQSLQLAKTDDFVVSVDVAGAYGKTSSAQGTEQKLDDPKLPKVTAGAPGTAPQIKLPSSAAPSTLQVKTLIQGTGPAVAKGKTLIAQYHGVVWPGGKVFDSTWQRGAPAGFQIGAGKVIPGWDKGLVGQKVGSRVLLVVPPADGYGKQGQPQAKIKGTDTLVFVVDILGTA